MADDVFAMGIVLHALEHGRMPAFYARARTQELTLLQRASLQPSGVLRGALRGAPPGSLDDLIARMLSVDAAERPTAAEALAELRSIAARTPLLRADEGP
jgi:serine/threonine protein kinase